jgi:hypothetical protein
MFIFLNSTLHNFGPENIVPFVEIRKFQRGFIEENENYKWCITYSQHAVLVGKKLSKTKTA